MYMIESSQGNQLHKLRKFLENPNISITHPENLKKSLTDCAYSFYDSNLNTSCQKNNCIQFFFKQHV